MTRNKRHNQRKNRLLNCRGLSLTELMVSAFIFSLMSAAVCALVYASNTIFQANDSFELINHNGMQILRSIGREVEQSSPDGNRLVIDPSGNIIRFQIPVDYDNDDDVTTNNLTYTVEWGAYDEANQTRRGSGADPLNRWARYQVVNNQLIRDVLDASLQPVNGLSRVVANNIQSFAVSKPSNEKVLTAAITMNVNNSINNKTYQAIVTQKIFLRNSGS